MCGMKLTAEKASAFLHILSETCNVGKACKAIDISRQTAYNWKADSPEFAAQWEGAMKIGRSALEDEAHRRAFEGNEERVYQNGQCVDTVRKYSDTLAIFLLKAHDPDKYRENSKVELSGNLAVSNMSEDQIRAELAALAATGVVPVANDGSDLI